MGEKERANWSVGSGLATKDIRMQPKPGLQPTLAPLRISHRCGDEVLLSLSHALRQRVLSAFPLSAAHEPLGVCLSLPDEAWISKPSQISVMKWTQSPLQRNVIIMTV